MQFAQRKTLCHSYENPDAGIKSWTSTTKSTQGHRIQSRGVTEAIY